MRRALLPGAVVALLLALPLAGRAAPAPAVTLTSPTSGFVRAGDLSVTWSYRGFSRTAFVDVEAARGDGPFARLARVRIDDGTPGFLGSFTWSTTSADDGDDWTIRLVVPSNKWVSSSVTPVVVDNTAPDATEIDRTPDANDAGWNNSDVTVTWACTDTVSGAVEAEVSDTVEGEGAGLSASAVCTDLAGNSATATAQGIAIDRTVPTVRFTGEPMISGTGRFAILGGYPGNAGDNLSGVDRVDVTFADSAGNEVHRAAQCFGCGTTSAQWVVEVHGIPPGRYTVTVVATDVADHASAPVSDEFVVVGMLTEENMPEGATASPLPVPGDLDVPEGSVPEVTPPPVTVPPIPPIGLPV